MFNSTTFNLEARLKKIIDNVIPGLYHRLNLVSLNTYNTPFYKLVLTDRCEAIKLIIKTTGNNKLANTIIDNTLNLIKREI